MITLDLLVSNAVLAAVILLVLASAVTLYNAASDYVSSRKARFVVEVVEELQSACRLLDREVVLGFEAEVDCESGKVCVRGVCAPVECRGGGKGTIVGIRGCTVYTRG